MRTLRAVVCGVQASSLMRQRGRRSLVSKRGVVGQMRWCQGTVEWETKLYRVISSLAEYLVFRLKIEKK